MQLYTLCVGWLYLEEMRAWEDLILLTFSLSNIVRVSILSETNVYYCEAKQSFLEPASLCFKSMEYGDASSNVYRSFLSAVIRTFNPLSKHLEQSACKHSRGKMIHPWIQPFSASNWCKNRNPSSNVYRPFLSAVIRTFNPFDDLSGARISYWVIVSKLKTGYK